jgi:hypothetical protein
VYGSQAGPAEEATRIMLTPVSFKLVMTKEIASNAKGKRCYVIPEVSYGRQVEK